MKSLIASLPESVRGWAFYDFANSSYVLVFQSFLLPVYFSTILLSQGSTLSAWGLANALSTAFGIILSINAGRFADKTNRLRIFKYLIGSSFIGMICVALSISFVPAILFWLFILTNGLFIASIAISDSVLPHISNNENSYEYSGFAWGFGYLGGIVSLIVVIILQHLTSEYSFWVFSSVALFYILFAMRAVKKLSNVQLNPDPIIDQTKNILTTKERNILFVGYWLVSECITVIILFFSIFASKEIGLSNTVIGALLLLVQLIGFPATYFGGRLTLKKKPIQLLGITMIIWGILICMLVLFKNIIALVIVTILAGLVIGNSQSYIRAQYSTLIKKSESGLRFGFYSFISQASVVIGPLLYGFASDRLHSQKIPIIILFVLMIIGYYLIQKATKNVISAN